MTELWLARCSVRALGMLSGWVGETNTDSKSDLWSGEQGSLLGETKTDSSIDFRSMVVVMNKIGFGWRESKDFSFLVLIPSLKLWGEEMLINLGACFKLVNERGSNVGA